MSVLASDVMSDARSTLIDDDLATYSDPQMLGFVSDAQIMVSNYKRDAYTLRDFIPMVAGTNQALPEGGLGILDLTQNAVSKRAITLCDKELLDEENRFWQAATGERDVQHWCADPRDPLRFDVTPPNNGAGSALALYAAVPPKLDDEADELVLVDTYKYAVYAFTLHRAYAETSRKGDTVKSEYWHQKGLQAIGITSAAQVQVAPKVSANTGE